jgi:hypothetical protein
MHITTALTADRENDAIFNFCTFTIQRSICVGQGRFPVRSRRTLLLWVPFLHLVMLILFLSLNRAIVLEPGRRSLPIATRFSF